MLIALPHGLGVSGVASWALRLAQHLGARGWPVRILAGSTPKGHRPLPGAFGGGVDVVQVPPAAERDHRAYVAFCRDQARAAGTPDRPVVFSPNLTSGSYAAAAAIATLEPELVRIVGWQHSDTAFDRSLLAYHEPMLHRLIAVSARIAGVLREAAPTRAMDVMEIPYGVEITPEADRPRFTLGEPIRLVYTGRIEHEQKRVGVLCELAKRLASAGVPHRLTLVGDGPAAAEVDIALASFPHANRLPPMGPEGVRSLLSESHLLVLPSHYEGLSVSMLEAMASGVAPVVTRVRSGATQAVEDGRTGVLINPEGSDADVADRFAAVVGSLATDPERVESLRSGAAARARSSYALSIHTSRVAGLFESVCRDKPRPWPADRACSYDAASSSKGGAGGSVPSDADERTERTLRDIVIRSGGSAKVAVLGAGRHTLAVAGVLAQTPATIVCVVDDNPAAHGKTLWGWPVVSADDAVAMGVTDVVISSWLHVGALWDGRERFTARGVRVHRLYGRGELTAACA